ncbi:G protein-coupled receptor 184 [Nematolebias whitei]|uniref:G protein-coupled receptor 184 n=1 Tax=Nematolebias whitei TaxID=451745 RepID=UPI00189BE449|nr:G protein-coupled receptor 184 [Nematolebias whitei]
MNVTGAPIARTTDSPCVQIGASPISDFLMAIYILAFILGLIFNVLTLKPICHQVKQRNVLGIFLLCLSISDMLYICTMPLWINYYHKDHNWDLGVISCSIAGFFYYSNMYISIYLLCCISVDRCLVVCHPLRFKTHRTSCYAWVQCSIVCATVVTMHIVILIFDNVKHAHDKNVRCYETYPMQTIVAIFNLVRVGLGFMLPLLVLAVSYWKVLATVGQSTGLNAQAKKKVRLLSFGVIGIFSVCFAPYHILLLARSLVYFKVGDDSPTGLYCQFEQNTHFAFSVTLALSSLNSVVDPVLYVLVSNTVREKLKLCWRRGLQTPTEDCALTAYNRGKPKENSLI